MKRAGMTRTAGVLMVLSTILGTGCATMPEALTGGPSTPLIKTLEGRGQGQLTLKNATDSVPRSTIGLDAPESLVRHRAPELYVRTLLGELMAHLPKTLPEDKEVDVFLTSHRSTAHLFATGANDILVSYPSLSAFDSRDELAFALAHELAHIALGHNQDQESIFSLDTAVKLTDKLLMLARTYEAVYQGPGEAARTLTDDEKKRLALKITQIRILAHGIRSSITGVLQGAWTRSQEREADRLGYDLLVAAGYNGQAASLLLDRFGSEPSLRDNVKTQVDKMEEAGHELVAITEESQFTAYFKQAGISSLAAATRGLLDLMDDTHKAAAERKTELYDDYVDSLGLAYNLERPIDSKAYANEIKRMNLAPTDRALALARESVGSADADIPPPHTTAIVSGAGSTIGFNRYTLYQIRKASNNNRSALQNLEVAWRNHPADYATSSQYALELSAQKRTAEAEKVVAFLESIYPTEAPLDDIRGQMLEQQNDVDGAKKKFGECDLHKKPHVRHRCESAQDDLETREKHKEMKARMATAQRNGKSKAQATESETAVHDAGKSAMGTLDRLKNWLKRDAQAPALDR